MSSSRGPFRLASNGLRVATERQTEPSSPPHGPLLEDARLWLEPTEGVVRIGPRINRLAKPPQPTRQPRSKRPFDLSVLVVAHLLPPFTLVWLLVWTVIPLAIWLHDRGPIFYRQRRIGIGGREFTILKFRTMVKDAEGATGAVWSPRGDERITPVGKLLRARKLDELPQVLNILRGEMSFVGPRPERPELHAQFVTGLPAFDERLAVLPGLTGLAQMAGEYDMSPAEKLKRDQEYIARMSMSLDAKLILRTLLKTATARWGR